MVEGIDRALDADETGLPAGFPEKKRHLTLKSSKEKRHPKVSPLRLKDIRPICDDALLSGQQGPGR